MDSQPSWVPAWVWARGEGGEGILRVDVMNEMSNRERWLDSGRRTSPMLKRLRRRSGGLCLVSSETGVLAWVADCGPPGSA